MPNLDTLNADGDTGVELAASGLELHTHTRGQRSYQLGMTLS